MTRKVERATTTSGQLKLRGRQFTNVAHWINKKIDDWQEELESVDGDIFEMMWEYPIPRRFVRYCQWDDNQAAREVQRITKGLLALRGFAEGVRVGVYPSMSRRGGISLEFG